MTRITHWATHCFCNFFLKFTWNNSEWIIKNVKHWSSPVFQVLFGFVLICFIAFAVYHYRQKLPVVQSALSNYHPGWSSKLLLSRATLRNTFQLIVPLVTQIVTIFPYWEVANLGYLGMLSLSNRGHFRVTIKIDIAFMMNSIPDYTFNRGSNHKPHQKTILFVVDRSDVINTH